MIYISDCRVRNIVIEYTDTISLSGGYFLALFKKSAKIAVFYFRTLFTLYYEIKNVCDWAAFISRDHESSLLSKIIFFRHQKLWRKKISCQKTHVVVKISKLPTNAKKIILKGLNITLKPTMMYRNLLLHCNTLHNYRIPNSPMYYLSQLQGPCITLAEFQSFHLSSVFMLS